MTVRELREKYLAFFESKGHVRFPSGSLIPFDVTGRLDESLLFNGAGMIQFKPYFLGVAEPTNRRLTNAQKCVRTGDIDEVGDDTHLTFFEMMGNFSFGDYFKKEAIAFSWEFITEPQWLGLDPKRVSFTVFDDDDEAYNAWASHLQAVGIEPETRIFRLDEETNFWPAGAFTKGPPGPCGPNSEMFYWVADEAPPASAPNAQRSTLNAYSKEDWLRDEAEGKWVEFWNDVFIQFNWQGTLRNPERPNEGFTKTGMPELPFRSIDTGMGLERTALVLGGQKTVYENDVFAPIFAKINEIRHGMGLDPIVASGLQPVSAKASDGHKLPDQGLQTRATRIIADHIRTACFCIADGILPSNTGRGYVLRRLIRRAVLKGQRVLGFNEPFFHLVYEGVVAGMGDHYTELVELRDVIVETLRNEEDQFRRTLGTGQNQLSFYLDRIVDKWVALVIAAMREDSTLAHRLGPSWIAIYNNAGPDDPDRYKAIDAHLWVQQRKAWMETPSSLEQLLREAVSVLSSVPLGNVGRKSLQNLVEPFLMLPGSQAFELYDTYGFPLEVTRELANEAGFEVDNEGYEQALKEAQERSRGGQERDAVYGSVAGIALLIEIEDDEEPAPTQTVFTGYDQTCTQTEIVGALPEADEQGLTTGNLVVALKESPFYAESGGQVGDTGTLAGGGFEGKVVDVIKQNGVWVHEVEPIRIPVDLKGKSAQEVTDALQKKLFRLQVEAEVDVTRRSRVIRNHTATHLLHAALRNVLGKHVTQAGSYVGPDRLRFDFTHGKAMSEEELAEVEKIVNEQVLKNTPVTIYQDLPIAEAKARGAMALFGEKYGDKVRMVEIGDFSKELCGGIHVHQTGAIGLFKIVHESSAASGVRRIEALTGEGAYEWVIELVEGLHAAAGKLKLPPKSGMKEVLTGIDRSLETQRDLKQRLGKARSQGPATASANIVQVGTLELAVEALKDSDAKDATALADTLAANQPNRVVVVGASGDGKITFVCKVGAEAVAKGAHAGNLLREIAKIAGGGGGGRLDFATAGGKDPAKLEEALAAAAGFLGKMVE